MRERERNARFISENRINKTDKNPPEKNDEFIQAYDSEFFKNKKKKKLFF